MLVVTWQATDIGPGDAIRQMLCRTSKLPNLLQWRLHGDESFSDDGNTEGR